MAFSYKSGFQDALAALKREGRYRVFADILRECGAYPKAGLFENGATHADSRGRSITVWCSNDYLDMGQHPDVLAAMHEAVSAVGAGSGGTRNIS
jgi:5-aminolevulinate synthase